MILNCALVDDEPLALDLLETYVRKTPFLNLVGKCSSAVAAMKELQEKTVDLLFLDIQMPELSGLEYSKMVNPETRIVFTTAFGQYALDGYRVNALDYLLKPISYKDFLEAANKALSWFEMKENASAGGNVVKVEDDCIYVKSDYKLVQIKLKDILYVEGLKDYVKIYIENEPKAILSLMSMKAMEERLPSSHFIRVHRSFIVQKNKIKIIDRGRIVFGKEYIPVSDSYKQELQNYLNEKTM
jgi:two-component system LytT family response regulator